MDPIKLIDVTPAQFAAIIALFLPGFISLRVDRLIHPNRERPAGDSLIEIVGYSLLNAGLLSWAILMGSRILTESDPDYVRLALIATVVCILGPVSWPLIIRGTQRWLARKRLVMSPHGTAWDDYFSRAQPCWIVVHLANGSSIGGYFGERSIASTGSYAGHLYLEELWQLGTNGDFLSPVPESKGAIFRPGDYLWIEMRRDD